MFAIFSTKKGAPIVSVTSNTVLTIAKLTAGTITGSVSVLSEGIHSATDLLASLMALFSVRAASKPADDKHQFGHGKIENISGTVEGALIFAAAGYIVYESIQKLIHGVELEKLSLGIYVMGGAALTNILVSRHLRRVGKKTDSVAIEADAMHLLTDVYTAAGVFVALILVQITGWVILDPIIAIVMALLIFRMAYQITAKSVGGLVDKRLPGHEVNRIARIVESHIGKIVSYKDLQTRKSGSERFAHLTLIVPKGMTVANAHAICDHIEEEVKEKFPTCHCILHTEPCIAATTGQCPPDCPLINHCGEKPLLTPEPTSQLNIGK
jgi:cation diffusion facilitator family transporter